MNAKPLLLLLAGSLVAIAAWYVYLPSDVQADPVPEKYQGVVQKGLEYLVKNQLPDGHWEGDDGKHPVAMTALVGIALLMDWDNPRPHGFKTGRTSSLEKRSPPVKYAAQLQKAADWLMKKANRDGLFYSGHASETSRYMEGHGLATMFLAGLYKVELEEARKKKFTDALAGAVKCIVKAQSSQGGWHHTSRVEGHDFDAVRPTSLQLQALQAAEYVVNVPAGVKADAFKYLAASVQKPASGPQYYESVAAMLACRSRHGFGEDGDKEAEKWLKRCQAEIPAVKLGRDELIHFYYAQALFMERGPWSAYRTAMFDHLQANQSKDGSWPAAEGFGVGPIYATALWCIVLQLDHRTYPAFQPPPSDFDVAIRFDTRSASGSVMMPT